MKRRHLSRGDIKASVSTRNHISKLTSLSELLKLQDTVWSLTLGAWPSLARSKWIDRLVQDTPSLITASLIRHPRHLSLPPLSSLIRDLLFLTRAVMLEWIERSEERSTNNDGTSRSTYMKVSDRPTGPGSSPVSKQPRQSIIRLRQARKGG